MKFWEFLKRDVGSKAEVASGSALSLLERELKAGAQLSALLERRESYGFLDKLPTQYLREIVDSYRNYEVWLIEATRVGRRLESIEREVISRTTRNHQLELIERALRLASQSRVEALDRPGVLAVSLELWDICRAEVRRRGEIKCLLARDDHPLTDQYADYINRTETIETLKPYRWLAMRRGERDGVLRLELKLDRVPFGDHVESRRSRLGKAADDRTVDSLLQELVLDDLLHAIGTDLDDWARAESLQFACDAYAGLLSGHSLKLDRLGTVFLGSPHHPVGVAVLDTKGNVLDYKELNPGQQGWIEDIVSFLQLAKVYHLAVPSDTRSSKRLAEIESRLGRSVELYAVRPVALTEARKNLVKVRDLPQSVGSAIVLGRRLLDPMKEWGDIDPVRVGVGEYQGDIDDETLREALLATRFLVRTQRKKAPTAPTARPIKKTPSLGPTVRTAIDLKPGMAVSGQVTNITGFGAFIALGLEYEGMVHVSELSDDFVANPTEVVKIGDKISAHVLAVDPKRRRISLSMRTQSDRSRSAPRRGSGGPHRNQALKDLESLFKK